MKIEVLYFDGCPNHKPAVEQVRQLLGEMTPGWYSSRRVGETCSGYKTLVEEGTDLILGAHLLAGQAEEVINIFAVAMRAGMWASDLRLALFSYPTHASDIPYML